jgi:flagellar basal-body rod protein FlgB
MDASPARNDLLLRLLAATELRARVVSGNLANLNTPGYKRREVNFEDLLRSALDRGASVEKVEAEVETDATSPARPDGNNVSLELELNSLRENRLLYETYAAILEGRMDLQRLAVTEGR